MSIQITKLNFSYPSSNSNLFDDFSLQISDGWTCIAGSNGCGKSTLLKLIAGILMPDSGKISIGKNNAPNVLDGSVVYCEQETAEIPENLYAAFWSDENDVRQFFSRLKINEEMLERYDSLSGGEKKRIQIACALSEKPDVLLLDEPTNHLDAQTVSLISETLSDFSGMGIMVSHDRNFSDSLCTRTIYLFNEAHSFSGGRDCISYESFPCGLTKALELKNQNAENSRGEWERLNSKAALEKQRSARLEAENQKSKSRLSKKSLDPHDHDAKRKLDVARIGGKDRSTGDAKARLETQIRQTESERDGIKKSLRRKEGFSLSETDFARSINIDECQISVSGHDSAGAYTLKIPHLEIKRGMKIALTGQNGSGKTLFIRHLISNLEKDGRKSELLYLPQEISDEERKKIIREFHTLDENERGEVLSTLFRLGSDVERLNHPQLGNADFSEAEDFQNMDLSPGEFRKLMISLAVQKPLSLLILDEPTNHMDITSVLALENALSSLDCAMIVVSHDRAFLEKITNVNLGATRNGNQGEIKMQI